MYVYKGLGAAAAESLDVQCYGIRHGGCVAIVRALIYRVLQMPDYTMPQ